MPNKAKLNVHRFWGHSGEEALNGILPPGYTESGQIKPVNYNISIEIHLKVMHHNRHIYFLIYLLYVYFLSEGDKKSSKKAPKYNLMY